MVEVRYFAGAAAAAGTEGEHLPLADGASVADLLALVADRHPPLVPVLEVASLLVDEVAVRDRTERVPAGAQIDVLPPFAGG